jgi:hypothetical protein
VLLQLPSPLQNSLVSFAHLLRLRVAARRVRRKVNLNRVQFENRSPAYRAGGADARPHSAIADSAHGMVERFNGRIGSEVLAITIYSHHQLEQLLHDFNAAYNARRQRVLEARTPDQVVAERLTAKPALAKNKPAGRADHVTSPKPA